MRLESYYKWNDDILNLVLLLLILTEVLLADVLLQMLKEACIGAT